MSDAAKCNICSASFDSNGDSSMTPEMIAGLHLYREHTIRTAHAPQGIRMFQCRGCGMIGEMEDMFLHLISLTGEEASQHFVVEQLAGAA